MKRVSRSKWDSLLVPRRCVCGNPIILSDLLAPSYSTLSSAPRSSSSAILRSSKPRIQAIRPFHTSPSLAVIPSLLPTQSAKLAALHGRLGLPSRFPLGTLGRALIDPTAEPQHHLNNDSLSNVGNVLLGYYTSEYLMVHYPRLPYEVLKSAMTGYIGSPALSAIGTEWGVEAAFAPGETVDPGLLQFNRLAPGERWNPTKGGIGFNTPRKNNRKLPEFMNQPESGDPESTARYQEAIPLEHAMANFVRATVGGVYLHVGGLPAVKEFIHAHVLSRKLAIESLFQFEQPTRELSRLCVREGFQSPIARLEKETGRYSRHAVFIVGVYSGEEKLGEGQGSSLPEAKIKAAISALKGWYLYSPAVAGVADLPSKTDGAPAGVEFKPAVIDVGDVVS
ncbi:hypothetical protein ABW19_dt0202046 [Dactylella cylindrospora]|nr:hypothetical protein ABW19_dt0202046 [Dactylella cylindrospora]